MKKSGKRTLKSKNWIQNVVKNMNQGAFTRQASREHETPLEYAVDVLRHPKKHRLRTRRRAQFVKNITRKTD
jgi:hypothetical protein